MTCMYREKCFQLAQMGKAIFRKVHFCPHGKVLNFLSRSGNLHDNLDLIFLLRMAMQKIETISVIFVLIFFNFLSKKRKSNDHSKIMQFPFHRLLSRR